MSQNMGNITSKKSNLPPDWELVKLGEVILEIADGGTPATSVEEYFNGEIPWVNIEDIKAEIITTRRKITQLGLENSSAKLWPKGTVIFSFGASIGKVGIAEVELATKQGIAGILVDPQRLNNKFLYYVLLKVSPIIQEIGKGMGSTVKEVRPPKLKTLIEIPLPPLPEQQKIVYVLDTIQEVIGVQEKIIEKTKELKRAMMNLLFHYGTAILKVKEFASLRVGELTSEEFEKLTGQKLKKTEIGEIPEDWEVVRLGEVTLIDRGLSWKRGDESKSGVLVVSIPNILDGAIDFTKSEIYLSIPIEEDKKLKKGDILFVGSSGSPENLGRSAMILKEPTIPTSFASFLLRIRPTCQISTNYLNLLLISSYINFKKCSRRAADGKYNLQPIELKLEKIPLPSLDEQREIADILQTIDQKIEIEKKKKALYEELFKAMLDKLMTGEIRVNNINFE